MAEHHPLTATAPWIEVVATQEDWDAADPDLLRTIYAQLVWIRAFEQYVLELAAAGLVHGPAHSSIGQEGGAVGSALALRTEDTINGSHRGHHQFLAKALHHVEPKGLDPLALPSDGVRTMLLRTLAEICGLERGWSHGRGGSMHLQWKEAGCMGTNAIVGGGVPIASGFAWSHRQAGTDTVSVTYFGDGAVNIGSTLESMNLAGAWDLPVCFFIENNQYAVSTSVREATAEPRLSARGLGFNIASWRVDGMDPLAVHLAMTEAVEHMRRGRGPAVVEADTYRFFHQSGTFPGSAFGYRSKEEEKGWRDRDPLRQTAAHLERRGLMTPSETAQAKLQAKAVMEELGAILIEPVVGGKPNERRIKEGEWPSPEFVDVGVRGDLSELAGAPIVSAQGHAVPVEEVRFVDAVSGVMRRRMETDPRVVVMGEDVHRLNGGTNGATRGLAERWPDRVLGTPISENAFAGLGGGIAIDGRYRPVVEFMYADFMWVAADQIFNQIGKARHMFGGSEGVPLVLRSKVAMGTGYGSQHSMDPAGIFASAPGWRIVAPTTPYDYVGLMNTALRLDDPVVVLEHVDLYTSRGPGPVDDFDYCLPVGKAAVRRPGADLTILTYLGMTRHVLDAVEEFASEGHGVDAEVIDLRWLDRASFDWETVEQSLAKTRRVLIAEQGPVGTSYGGWLGDELHRRFADLLDAPVQRVTAGEASPSISKVLERAAIAQKEEVLAALAELATAGTPPPALASPLHLPRPLPGERGSATDPVARLLTALAEIVEGSGR